MVIRKVGKYEFLSMMEKLRDFSRKMEGLEPTAYPLKEDLEEVKISTSGLLQIMEAIDRRLEAGPNREIVLEHCRPFYEMSREILARMEELQLRLKKNARSN